MRKDLTDITLVVDRSGSMNAVRSDAEGGINAYIEDQAKAEGEALLTIVEFDTEYDFVTRGELIQDVKPYQLVPRGGTALLDAVGRAVVETGARLAAMPEAERPGLVVFVIMTDGKENSSREFTNAQVKEMIETQQTVYSWRFLFLGANQDAFAEAGGMGIDAVGVAQYAASKTRAAYATMSRVTTSLRTQTQANETIDTSITDDERTQME